MLYRAFDPSEPRDEGGKWTDGGGDGADGGDGAGYEFVSPNVGNLDFHGAVNELGSQRQGVLRDASESISRELGMEATSHDVVGAWSDGAENSVMDVVGHSDWEKLKLSGAMKGWLADQKAVLIFQQRDAGEGVLASFEAKGNINEIHQNLLADGLANHTLVPTPAGATVYVADLDNTQSKAIEKAAERYDAEVQVHFGHGEFVGIDSYEGSDREQRDRARDLYETHIDESPVQGSKEIWDRVRDRWGAALAASDTAARKIYVRPGILKAFEAITAAIASGVEIVAYDGDHIPGTELIELSERAAPQTLYVHRPLLNADDVIVWAKSVGFEKTITPDDMHVTIAFSRDKVDWDAIPQNVSTLTIDGGGERSVARLGPEGKAVVLRFESQALAERWRQIIAAGASWDYEDYKPHITISFDAPDIDVAGVVPYDGELIFGPEVFAELKEDWADSVVEREWDESKHPRVPAGSPGGGEFGEGGGGGDAADDKPEAGDKKPDEPPPPPPDPQVVDVGGDEWNKQTAERLEKEFVEASPSLDAIVREAVSGKVEVEQPAEDEEPDPDNAPYVPEEWDTMSQHDQELAEEKYKEQTFNEFQQSEIDNWYENSATDDAATHVAYEFQKGHETEWAEDAIKEYRDVNDDVKIPFTDAQILGALTVEFDNSGYNDASKVDIGFDDDKLGKPEGFDESPTLPGIIAPEKPSDFLTKDMRDGLTEELTKAFVKEADKERDKMEPPDYLGDSVTEMQGEYWDQMEDKAKFDWASSNTDIISDYQKEYDEYFGDKKPGVDTGKIDQLPNKFDPLQQNASAADYQRTQQIARHLSIERAAQIMMTRKLYDDVESARKDAKSLDRSLWEAWKGSSHGSGGQLLQKATAEELGGRLNPGMVTMSKMELEQHAGGIAQNVTKGTAYEAVKAYVRGKWETTQYLLKQAGVDTVNAYRAVNIKETAPPGILGPGTGGDYRVTVSKSFETKEEAGKYMDAQIALHGKDYSGSVETDHNNPRVFSRIEFRNKEDAEGYIKKYVSDPNNPEQHGEDVKASGDETTYTRLPDIHVDRNGAASASTDAAVSNGWDGGSGRVVLRASVPRTAVVSVPAYGINIQSEHEVVVAGTAWKGWDAWYNKAPPFDTIKIGHQIAAAA